MILAGNHTPNRMATPGMAARPERRQVPHPMAVSYRRGHESSHWSASGRILFRGL